MKAQRADQRLQPGSLKIIRNPKASQSRGYDTGLEPTGSRRPAASYGLTATR